MAFEDAVDLYGIDEHAAYFRALVRATHRTLYSRGRPTAGTLPRQDRRQITRTESDQRIVFVQNRDKDLAFRDRFAGAGSDDLNDHALVQD